MKQHRLKVTTAGESHGPSLVGILEGMPAGVTIDLVKIQEALYERRTAEGRSARQGEEEDRFDILAGLFENVTTGAPIAVVIPNRVRDNGRGDDLPWSIPRPGHADYAVAARYSFTDYRQVAERASARGTALDVALGAIAHQLLQHFGIEVSGEVEELGDVDEPKRFSKQLKEAVAAGETLGGVVSIQAEGVPRGLGSPFQQSLRLDGAIASAMMTIPAVKALEIGEGIAQTEMPGSVAQDKFDHSEEQGIFRTSNLAGGVEGGCSNGEAITVRLFIKPIPTLPKHMKSIDPVTGKSAEVVPLRSDVTAVFATVPIARARMQLLLADFLLERFGGQTLGEVVRNYQATCLNFPVEQA